MKSKIILSLLTLCLLVVHEVSAQPSVRVTQLTSSRENQFEVINLQPSQQGAFFTHLWWFGDGGFSFINQPIHSYDNSGSGSISGISVVTENYGTGGPPPLPLTVYNVSSNPSPISILNPGKSIYMQHYRNAVINDTMYVILTYGNTGYNNRKW